MSGLSFFWRFALVGLRFSLAYEARRSTLWESQRDFHRGVGPGGGLLGRERLGSWSVCGPHLELVLGWMGGRGGGRKGRDGRAWTARVLEVLERAPDRVVVRDTKSPWYRDASK